MKETSELDVVFFLMKRQIGSQLFSMRPDDGHLLGQRRFPQQTHCDCRAQADRKGPGTGSGVFVRPLTKLTLTGGSLAHAEMCPLTVPWHGEAGSGRGKGREAAHG